MIKKTDLKSTTGKATKGIASAVTKTSRPVSSAKNTSVVHKHVGIMSGIPKFDPETIKSNVSAFKNKMMENFKYSIGSGITKPSTPIVKGKVIPTPVKPVKPVVAAKPVTTVVKTPIGTTAASPKGDKTTPVKPNGFANAVSADFNKTYKTSNGKYTHLANPYK